jgi:hypothetical protein
MCEIALKNKEKDVIKYYFVFLFALYFLTSTSCVIVPYIGALPK